VRPRLWLVFGLLAALGHPVGVFVAPDAYETLGCNDRAELAGLRALLRDRVNRAWMRAGVSILDPATTWIDVTVTLEPDAEIDQNSQLLGATRVGAGAIIGPDSTLIDTVVGEGAVVLRTHSIGAEIGPLATVGPFSFLRPGTRLGRKAKVGGFVETKNADLGDGAKVPHLSYVGDATIGEESNIGAASVFVNYDGVSKSRTTIGSHCRTGSDNMFVAPVTIGDGAYTGAGTVVRKDVPPGALAINVAPQRNLEGWVQEKRAGTAAAQAATDALARISSSPDDAQDPTEGTTAP
jgi:bifunctional UDP-N-acetylglucosamine pyrophosphorylase/glucosamine-1-phosphate N-acetyltransferase